jgi:UDP-N-acetylmuramoyl-tripeptide--D-alanyl-D-alanine ligase
VAMNINDLYDKFLIARTVSTDSRRITEGCLFFALRGDRFNANAFADEALQKGAGFVVIDDPQYRTSERHILVDDVLTALQELAKYHRAQLKIPVVGLTGSNGKTTSKELLNTVLSQKYRTFATQGNLNNHIGVPLSILSIDPDYEMAVIEMGANHLGEIALLCSISQPTHGFITNIGKAHIGTFGGFENIIRGKSELYDHLLRHNGTVFINSRDEILSNMARRFREPLMYYQPGDYYTCSLIEANPFISFRAENGETVRTNLIGAYNFENIAAALCIGKFFQVDPTAANKAVAAYTPGNMRSQVVRKENRTIILDAYNANPSSMKAAVENLASMNADRKVLILGDMFELEEEAEKEHQALGKLVQDLGFSEVYLCGKLMKVAQLEIPSAKHFEKKEELIDVLRANDFANATVLVKASRGIGLESVIDYL